MLVVGLGNGSNWKRRPTSRDMIVLLVFYRCCLYALYPIRSLHQAYLLTSTYVPKLFC